MWLEDPSRAMKMSTFIDDARIPGVAAVYFRGEANGRPQYLPSPALRRRFIPHRASL